MSALSIQPVYPIFTDIDGQPLEDGYIWIGQVDHDPQVNPIAVFWDANLTIPAAQPIRTLNGYPSNSGTPARLYVDSDYSIRVMNKKGSVAYSAPSATERYNCNGNSGTVSVAEEVQTATAGQTVFTLTTMTYQPGENNLSVYVDGINQIVNDAYFETSNAVVTFTSGLHEGALVKFSTAVSQSSRSPEAFTQGTVIATAGQTVVTVGAYSSISTTMQVYLNGLLLQPGEDYTETTSTTITMVSPLDEDDIIKYFIWGGIVQGYADASTVNYTPAGASAVDTTVQAKLRESVSVKDFGAVGDGVADDTAPIQAAIDYATVNGHSLYVPAGHYLISSTLNLIRPSGEHRGDSFRIYGDGGGNVFLGTDLCPATVISTTTDIPIFTVPERYTSGFNNLYVEYMRLQQDNAAATQPVVLINSTGGYSRWANLEIKQLGLGDGIKIVKGYLITIEFTNVVNKDFVAGSGTVRVGTGINVPSAQAGGLLTLRKVTSRGWLNAYIIGNGSTGLYATKMDQCECSTVTNGITIEAGVSKTSIDTCYFEGVYGKCVIDKGRSTTVSDCIMFNGFATGIDSTNTAVYGAVYRDNYILIDGTNSIGIDVYADGDALGHQKLIAGNHIYFLSSGGAVAGVNGIKITGSNPSLSIIDNNFRPRREWVGGAGTIKINNASTGKITGVIPVTDTLFEFPMYSQAMISLAQGTTLTQSSVTAGDMAIGAGCSFDVNFSAATNITSINLGGKDERILLFRLYNTNATFVDSASGQLRMAGDFSGPGMIMFRTAIVGGLTYAYEISRSTH